MDEKPAHVCSAHGSGRYPHHPGAQFDRADSNWADLDFERPSTELQHYEIYTKVCPEDFTWARPHSLFVPLQSGGGQVPLKTQNRFVPPTGALAKLEWVSTSGSQILHVETAGVKTGGAARRYAERECQCTG